MLLYTHSQCLEHETHPGHPERPDRLRALIGHLETTGILDDCEAREAPLAAATDLARVHTHPYLDHLLAVAPSEGLVQLDPDTALCPASLDAATRAAGSVVAATQAVLRDEDRVAFCAVRPPGHHAESDGALGFCVYNSVAVAAAAALATPGIDRVAILDFDVHHGNGSVEIFADDPRVLVCSSFQFPYYPGRYDDIVRDHIVLTPLAAGTNGSDFRRAVEASWFARIAAHQPQLILVSAGFDAHREDPLADLNLDESDFTWITREIRGLAADHADGRIVSTLEGGYDLSALSRSAQAHVQELMA